MALFATPQIVLFTRDIERTISFYTQLGFRETFRVPHDGAPVHVDLELDGYRLGFATEQTTRDDHGLDPVATGQRAAVVVWTTEIEAAYQRLLDLGATALQPPHPFLDRLRIAWVQDPDGHPIQIAHDATSR